MSITPKDLGSGILDQSIDRLRARKDKWQKSIQNIARGNGRALESDQRKLKAELRQNALADVEVD